MALPIADSLHDLSQREAGSPPRRSQTIVYRLHTATSTAESLLRSCATNDHEQYETRKSSYLIDRVPSDPDDSHDYMIPETPIDIQTTTRATYSSDHHSQDDREDGAEREGYTRALRNRRSLPRIVSAPELRSVAEGAEDDGGGGDDGQKGDEKVPPLPRPMDHRREWEDWYGSSRLLFPDSDTAIIAATAAAAIPGTNVVSHEEGSGERKARRRLSRKFSASVQSLRSKGGLLSLMREQQEIIPPNKSPPPPPPPPPPLPPVPALPRDHLASNQRSSRRLSWGRSFVARIRAPISTTLDTQRCADEEVQARPCRIDSAETAATTSSKHTQSTTATSFILSTPRRALETTKLSLKARVKHAARGTLHGIKRLPANSAEAISSMETKAGNVVDEVKESAMEVVRSSTATVRRKSRNDGRFSGGELRNIAPPLPHPPPSCPFLATVPPAYRISLIAPPSSGHTGRPDRSGYSPLCDDDRADNAILHVDELPAGRAAKVAMVIGPDPARKVDVLETAIFAGIIPHPPPPPSRRRRKQTTSLQRGETERPVEGQKSWTTIIPTTTAATAAVPHLQQMNEVDEDVEENRRKEVKDHVIAVSEQLEPPQLRATTKRVPVVPFTTDATFVPASLADVQYHAQDTIAPMLFVTYADGDEEGGTARNSAGSATNDSPTQRHFCFPICEAESSKHEDGHITLEWAGRDLQGHEGPAADGEADIVNTAIDTRRRHWYNGRLSFSSSDSDSEEVLQRVTSQSTFLATREEAEAAGPLYPSVEEETEVLPLLSRTFTGVHASDVNAQHQDKTAAVREEQGREQSNKKRKNKKMKKSRGKHGKGYIALMLVGSLVT